MGAAPQGRHGAMPAVPAPPWAREAAALGRRVHELRTRAGFSPAEFAVLTGLSADELSHLEGGEPHAAIGSVFAVADALGMTAAQLLAPEGRDAREPAPDHRPGEMPESWAPPPIAPVTPLPAPSAPARTSRDLDQPRTFADLRVGPLAGRTFETLPQFAVAAVVELGHPVWVVAKIFRVPAWKLEAWVRDGVSAPPPQRPRRSWA